MAEIKEVDRTKTKICDLVNSYETQKKYDDLRKYLISKGRDLKQYNARQRIPGTYKIYRIEGPLTEEDVKWINANNPENSIYVMKNTIGQKSNIIEKLNPSVLISVYGGFLDINNVSGYASRTMHRASSLTKIIKIFETIEQGIKPEWSDIKKCLYCYMFIARNMKFMRQEDPWYERYDEEHIEVENSLACLLGKKGVCAGLALAFKELMDRIGIPCLYQNTSGLHDFNIVHLDGKWRGIDITWDSGRDKSLYNNFATKEHDEFKKQEGHQGYSADYTLYAIDKEVLDSIAATIPRNR